MTMYLTPRSDGGPVKGSWETKFYKLGYYPAGRAYALSQP